MKKETLFYKKETAIEEATKNASDTVRVALASDFCNLQHVGYDKEGATTFHIYRTFDERFKPAFQIRYPARD